jgi:YaiO family outer membrane protein
MIASFKCGHLISLLVPIIALSFSVGQVYAVEPGTCLTNAESNTRYSASQALSSDDAATRFSRAQAYMQAGKYQAALDEYTTLMIIEPNDVDYVFGRAQALFLSGETIASLRCSARARELAPDYEDVWKFELRVLSERHGRLARHEAREFRATARSQFPDASWLAEPIPQTAFRWEFGADREHLDNGAPDWQKTYVYVDHRGDSGNVVHLTAAAFRRFDLSDTEFGVGSTMNISNYWLLTGAVNIGSDANFLPRYTLDAGASRKFDHGWIAGLSGRNRHYSNDTVSTLGLHVERYFGKYRFAYSFASSRLHSEVANVQSAAFGVYADSGHQFGMSIGAGEEVEMVAAGQLLRTSITTVSLTGRHPIGKFINLVWRLGRHRQGSLYQRELIGVSLAGAF